MPLVVDEDELLGADEMVVADEGTEELEVEEIDVDITDVVEELSEVDAKEESEITVTLLSNGLVTKASPFPESKATPRGLSPAGTVAITVLVSSETTDTVPLAS